MKKNIIIICLALLIMGCNTEKERVIDTTDPYLWLEDVEGADALDWVKSQNKITETRYAESDEFSSTNIPTPSLEIPVSNFSTKDPSSLYFKI